MSVDRITGGAVVVFGGFLLVWAIPHNVVSTGELFLNPALFPRIAAWLLIGLGAMLMLFSRSEVALPPAREPLRLVLVAGLTLICLLIMERVGFLPATIALLAVITVISYERRWLWITTIVLALPAIVWAFFEIILRRPLP